LARADLSGAELREANLALADLRNCNLHCADLTNADLTGADLSRTDLTEADLRGTNLTGARLTESDLNNAIIGFSILGDVDLSAVKGLITVQHLGPSVMGIDTLLASGGNIPEVFLRGVGLTEAFITYLPALIGTSSSQAKRLGTLFLPRLLFPGFPAAPKARQPLYWTVNGCGMNLYEHPQHSSRCVLPPQASS
jgi:hypothetical protein